MHFPLTLPTDKPFDAVGFGLNAVDHLIVVPAYPAFDTKMRLLDHKQSAGGQTASAMVALRRLGLKTAYAGRFGSDPEGLFGFQTLKDDGVNVDFAEIVEGARNQIAFITIDARSGERTNRRGKRKNEDRICCSNGLMIRNRRVEQTHRT